MSKAVAILMEEHQKILKVIQALLKQCDMVEKKGLVNLDFFVKAIDFIKNYADKFHHAKEEDILFVELNKDSAAMHCNPIQQMLYEHDLGRNCVKELEIGVKKNDPAKVLNGGRGYVNLLQQHIYKEDNILYPMADEALNNKAKNEILAKFEEVAKKYSETNKKYELFLNDL